MVKINLKVFINKSNGQSAIHLPKKMFNEMPTNVSVDVPKQFFKKRLF